LLLLKKLEPILEGEIRNLDPQLPTILLAHVMADRATFGAEKFLAVGKGFTIPLALINRPEFDYVALGHVHKHQNLNPHNNPPVVYPGSIERVDFGEEKEDKGYVWLEIAKGKVDWQFCPLPARPFKTIKVDVTEAEDPQAELLTAISKNAIENAVVRLIYQIRSEQLEQVDNRSLREALKLSHSHTIRPELVSQLARPRLPELGVGSALDPLVALRTYLENKEDIKTLLPDLIAAAEHLLSVNDGENWLEAD
jgi:exonuclease SbcD